MPEHAAYPVPADFADAHINAEQYATLYRQSLEDPDSFWSAQAECKPRSFPRGRRVDNSGPVWEAQRLFLPLGEIQGVVSSQLAP